MARLADSERPKDRAGIQRLIRRRRASIKVLEALLQNQMPADIRKITKHRLHGEQMSLAAWQDYLRRMK